MCQSFVLNKLKIANLDVLLDKIARNLPSLNYLSLLSNQACPNELSFSHRDEEDYQRYRWTICINNCFNDGYQQNTSALLNYWETLNQCVFSFFLSLLVCLSLYFLPFHFSFPWACVTFKLGRIIEGSLQFNVAIFRVFSEGSFFLYTKSLTSFILCTLLCGFVFSISGVSSAFDLIIYNLLYTVLSPQLVEHFSLSNFDKISIIWDLNIIIDITYYT